MDGFNFSYPCAWGCERSSAITNLSCQCALLENNLVSFCYRLPSSYFTIPVTPPSRVDGSLIRQGCRHKEILCSDKATLERTTTENRKSNFLKISSLNSDESVIFHEKELSSKLMELHQFLYRVYLTKDIIIRILSFRCDFSPHKNKVIMCKISKHLISSFMRKHLTSIKIILQK